MAGSDGGTGQTIRRVAVLDVGKTNAKVVLIDRTERAARATLTRHNDVLPGPPYPHHDTDGLWDFFIDGLGKLQREHGIDGISVTTHGATGALIAGDSLALPILDYEHDGPESTGATYDAIRPPFAETLSPRLPVGLNLGAQIYWQSQAFPEAFARATAILMYPQYWVWKLTGVLASEVTSLGCHTDLWNPAANALSTLVTTCNWRSLFPPIRPAASVAGTILPDVARATGLPETTPVACGVHDSNASLLPYLAALERPFTIISSGTWTIIMTVGGDTDRLDAARDCLANVDATGRPTPTARFMGGREYELLVGPTAPQPSDADIAAVIGKGVHVLPTFVPGVGPFPDATGRWTEPAASLSSAEQAAAATLYLALVTRVALGLTGSRKRIVVEGPLAGNAAYCGLLSALTGLPVHASADSTGTSAGAAMLFDAPASGPAPSPLPSPVAPLAPDGLTAYAERWEALADS